MVRNNIKNEGKEKMRNRIIKKIGNSWFIKLSPIDIKDFSLSEGDTIDLESSLYSSYVHKKGVNKNGI
jgi:hypothetical protein